jgi:hypothetical protein
VALEQRPWLLAEHENGDSSLRKIPDVFVGGQEQFKPGFFRRQQQVAIVEFAPTLLKSGTNRLPSR